MADVTRTDDIAASRAADIRKTKRVTATKKVTRKHSRMSLKEQERASSKDRKGKKSKKAKKDHIDVYA